MLAATLLPDVCTEAPGTLSLEPEGALCWRPAGMVQGMKPSAPAWMHGPFPLLCLISPPLLHLWLLIASIYYSVILQLLNYVEIRAAEEQGEAEAVGYGETCSAGVHSAPHPRRPAFHLSPPYVIAVLAGLCVPCVQQRWDRGKGGTAPGQVPLQWARAVGAAGTRGAASAGEVPTSVCRLGHSAADQW